MYILHIFWGDICILFLCLPISAFLLASDFVLSFVGYLCRLSDNFLRNISLELV